MGRLLSAFGVLCTATVLALGAFVGYLFVAGRLNPYRVQTMAAVIRGELDDLPERLAATARESGAQEAAPPPSPSAEAAHARSRREDLESLRLERASQDLEAQRTLLDQALATVVTEQEKVATAKASIEEERQIAATPGADEGFRKELDYVTTLKPGQAKEYIVRVWQKHKADAVRLMSEMDPSRGRRILEQFKTSEELQIMTELLEQIRLKTSAGHASASGKTDGATSSP